MPRKVILNNEIYVLDNGKELDMNDVPEVVETANVGGATGDRPTEPVLYQSFFDTTLGKPVWHDGTNWVDATGTIA